MIYFGFRLFKSRKNSVATRWFEKEEQTLGCIVGIRALCDIRRDGLFSDGIFLYICFDYTLSHVALSLNAMQLQ